MPLAFVNTLFFQLFIAQGLVLVNHIMKQNAGDGSMFNVITWGVTLLANLGLVLFVNLNSRLKAMRSRWNDA